MSNRMRAYIQIDQKQPTIAALEAEILKGLESGASSPMTPEDWQAIRAKVRQRSAGRRPRA